MLSKEKPILVLGSGRCGSTLVQRILNTSAEATIWGEHAGFLKDVWVAYYTLMHSPQMQENCYTPAVDPGLIIGPLEDMQTSINWINPFTQATIQEQFRSFLRGIFAHNVPPNIRWGFKEILYTKNDGMMQLWAELFPASQVIGVVREPRAVIQSCILSWNSGAASAAATMGDKEPLLQLIRDYAKRWRLVNESLLYWQQHSPLPIHILRYEELLTYPTRELEGMFAFLELPVPEQAMTPLTVSLENSQHHDVAAFVAQLLTQHEECWKPEVAPLLPILGYLNNTDNNSNINSSRAA